MNVRARVRAGSQARSRARSADRVPDHKSGSNYGRVAPFYEAIARVCSRGRIGRAKAEQVQHLKPGQRVLYAGVGAGEDAVCAARMGCRVTALDSSAAMLARTERRFASIGAPIELCHEDFFAHRGGPYDVVVTNFFLNVFDPIEVETGVDTVVSLLRPGHGRWLVADFAPPRSAVERVVFELHYRPLLLAAWALGLGALHPIYDYAAMARRRGLHARAHDVYAPFGRRFAFYESRVFDV